MCTVGQLYSTRTSSRFSVVFQAYFKRPAQSFSLSKHLLPALYLLSLVSCGGSEDGSKTLTAITESSTQSTSQTAPAHTVQIEWNSNDYGYENEFVAIIDGSKSSNLAVEYQWTVNGAIIVDENYNNLSVQTLPNWFSGGDVIGLEVTFATESTPVIAESFVIPNQQPLLLSTISFEPAEAGVSDRIGLAEFSTYDADDDELTISYQWSLNGTVLPDQNQSTLPPGTARYPDTVSVLVSVTDGTNTTFANPISLELSDTPPYFESDIEATPLQYGQSFSATGKFFDPDGTAVTTELQGGPDGFIYDAADGSISWDVKPLMFRNEEIYHAHFKSGDGETFSISLTVKNPLHKSWLARSGIEPIQTLNGLHIRDFDNDGINEILGTDNIQRIFTLEYKDNVLRQDWLYPYPTPDRMPIQRIYPLDNQQIIIISEQSASLVNSRAAPPTTVFEPATKIRSSAYADVDLNGEKELILLLADQILIVDPNTWTQSGSPVPLPPTDANYPAITTGNIDSDPALEIIVGSGHVIDGATKAIQWTLNSGFGTVVTGDLDGDNRSEIIGKKYSTLPTIYDAVLQSEIYSLDIDSVCGMAIDNVDEDPHHELLVGPCTGQHVYIYDASTGSAVLQEEISSRPENANPLSRFSSSHTSLVMGDVDNDGIRELVFATEEHMFVAALHSLNDVSPPVPYSNNNPATLGKYYLSGWTNITPGKPAAVFVTPRTESRGAFAEDGQSIAILEETGEVTVNKATYGNWSNSTANALFDSNADGIAEILVSVGDPYDGIVQHIRLDDFTLLHEHINLGSDDDPEVLSIESVDEYPALAVMAIENNRVQLYDVASQSPLWTSPQMPGELLGANPFLDSDDLKILIRTYTETSIWKRNGGFFIREHTVPELCKSFVALTTQGKKHFACAGSQNFWSNEAFVLYDSTLNKQYEFTHDFEITALTSTPEGNLLLGITEDGSNYLQHSANKLLQISPITGQVIWESEPMLGKINGIQVFTDSDESTPRVVVATDYAMYLSK